MAASRRRGRRTAAVAATLAAVALTAGLTTGCDAVNKALDCVQTAEAIADSVTDVQQAVQNAGNDPTQIDDALQSVENNLDKIDNDTGDADIDKATQHMREALTEIHTSLQNGDKTPDLSPLTDAAGELTKVCTP